MNSGYGCELQKPVSSPIAKQLASELKLAARLTGLLELSMAGRVFMAMMVIEIVAEVIRLTVTICA